MREWYPALPHSVISIILAFLKSSDVKGVNRISRNGDDAPRRKALIGHDSAVAKISLSTMALRELLKEDKKKEKSCEIAVCYLLQFGCFVKNG